MNTKTSKTLLRVSRIDGCFHSWWLREGLRGTGRGPPMWLEHCVDTPTDAYDTERAKQRLRVEKQHSGALPVEKLGERITWSQFSEEFLGECPTVVVMGRVNDLVYQVTWEDPKAYTRMRTAWISPMPTRTEIQGFRAVFWPDMEWGERVRYCDAIYLSFHIAITQNNPRIVGQADALKLTPEYIESLVQLCLDRENIDVLRVFVEARVDMPASQRSQIARALLAAGEQDLLDVMLEQWPDDDWFDLCMDALDARYSDLWDESTALGQEMIEYGMWLLYVLVERKTGYEVAWSFLQLHISKINFHDSGVTLQRAIKNGWRIPHIRQLAIALDISVEDMRQACILETAARQSYEILLEVLGWFDFTIADVRVSGYRLLTTAPYVPHVVRAHFAHQLEARDKYILDRICHGERIRFHQ